MAKTAPALRCKSPWLLSSVAHIATPTERVGRQLLAELKTALRWHRYAWPGQGDAPLPFWAGVQTSREDRLRNTRRTTLTGSLQSFLQASSPANSKTPYRVTCWKSATTVLGGKRIATSRRTPQPGAPTPTQTAGCGASTTIFADFILDWHDEWWDQATFTATEADVTSIISTPAALRRRNNDHNHNNDDNYRT